MRTLSTQHKKITWFLVVLTLVISVFLSGCATTAKYRAQVDRWRGHNINELMQAWGPPDSSFKMPNGNMYYSYRVHHLDNIPSYYVPGTTSVSQHGNRTVVTSSGGYRTGGGVIESNCTTSFQVNPKGLIISTHIRGNACVAD